MDPVEFLQYAYSRGNQASHSGIPTGDDSLERFQSHAADVRSSYRDVYEQPRPATERSARRDPRSRSKSRLSRSRPHSRPGVSTGNMRKRVKEDSKDDTKDDTKDEVEDPMNLGFENDSGSRNQDE